MARRRHAPEPLRTVDEWVDEHTEPPGGGPKYLHTSDGSPTRGELIDQQQEESAHGIAGPGMPMMTGGQWKGFVIGALVGGLIGACLFGLLAFIPFGGSAFWIRLVACLAAGALGGGTAGALYLGGRLPELENETLDADGRPQVGTTARDPHFDDRGR